MMCVRSLTLKDVPQVKEICTNVFGGRDFLPAILPRLLEEPDTFVYGIEASGELLGVCVTVLVDEGRTAYLFGRRVSEDRRDWVKQ